MVGCRCCRNVTLCCNWRSVYSSELRYWSSSSYYALQLWESFGLLNDDLPFGAILDKFCPLNNLHPSHVIPHIVFPSGLGSFCWSSCERCVTDHLFFKTKYVRCGHFWFRLQFESKVTSASKCYGSHYGLIFVEIAELRFRYWCILFLCNGCYWIYDAAGWKTGKNGFDSWRCRSFLCFLPLR
jgi:hypothetical protein